MAITYVANPIKAVEVENAMIIIQLSLVELINKIRI